MLQLVEEPFVYLRKVMYLVDCITSVHSLRYDEYTLVSRFAKRCIDIFYLKFLILNKAVHALSYHAQTFLYSLFKVTSDSHNLTHRLH